MTSAFATMINRLVLALPAWLVSILGLTIAAAAALLLHRALLLIIRRFTGAKYVFLQSLIARTTGATRFALVVSMIGAAISLLPLSNEASRALAAAITIADIALAGWAAMVAVELASQIYLRRFNIESEDNLLARKHVTQVRILQRVAQTLLVLTTIAAILMSFQSVRQFGVSLIASAGAAGIIMGLAARPLLTNLIAGVQIAMTQPIRIGDAVIVENEWGWVEEILSTYVVIQLWDWRRLIVPLGYFLEKPFQNWTRNSSNIIGTVLLWVDYTVPVADIRQKLDETVRASPLWDKAVANLQVTDTTEAAVQLRILVSARNSSQAWDLRCDVREKLIAFLQQRYPDALPRRRNELRIFDGMSQGSAPGGHRDFPQHTQSR